MEQYKLEDAGYFTRERSIAYGTTTIRGTSVIWDETYERWLLCYPSSTYGSMYDLLYPDVSNIKSEKGYNSAGLNQYAQCSPFMSYKVEGMDKYLVVGNYSWNANYAFYAAVNSATEAVSLPNPYDAAAFDFIKAPTGTDKPRYCSINADNSTIVMMYLAKDNNDTTRTDKVYATFVVADPSSDLPTFPYGKILVEDVNTDTNDVRQVLVASNKNGKGIMATMGQDNDTTLFPKFYGFSGPSYGTSNLTASNFIGFAQSDAIDGEDVVINSLYSENISQSGLVQGTTYYVEPTGDLQPRGSNSALSVLCGVGGVSPNIIEVRIGTSGKSSVAAAETRAREMNE